MRTSAPINAIVLLTMATSADDAASRRRTVSEVTRVTNSPVGLVARLPTVARKYLLTIDSRASRTIRSASVPSMIH